MTPVEGLMDRTRPPSSSATHSVVPSVATPNGRFTVAEVDWPPSPVLEDVPVPAMARMRQMEAGEEVGVMEGVRVLLALALDDALLVPVPLGDRVAVRDGDAVGSSDSQPASQRTARTRAPVHSPMYTFTTPVLFSHATPMELKKVADRAPPPSPAEVHVPVPANACTTPDDVMRRVRQPLISATSRLLSGSTAMEMGSRNLAAPTSPPSPVDEAVPSPPSVVITHVVKSTLRRRLLDRSQMISRLPCTTIPSGRFSRPETAAPPSPLLPEVPAELTMVVTAPVVRLTSRTRWSLVVLTNAPSTPHAATARVFPNAVPLASTPVPAACPADRHVPVPATEYVRPDACDTATTTQPLPVATAKSPLGSTAD